MNRLSKIVLFAVFCLVSSRQVFAQNKTTHTRPGGQNTSIFRKTVLRRAASKFIPLVGSNVDVSNECGPRAKPTSR